MVIPWNGDAMSIPWKFHGNFIWAKTHGKLMDFSLRFSWDISVRAVINTDILLSPTEDLSLQQSIRFISTLATVILLLERTSVTTAYIHTYIHT